MPARRLTEAEAREYLAKNDTGYLATCGPDGPYIVPLNYIFYNDSIYFHCAHEGKKLDNIRHNDKICFAVSHTEKIYQADTPCGCGTRYMSVLAYGTASLIEDEAEKIEVLNVFTAQLVQGKQYASIDSKMAASCAVMRIRLTEINGKRNVDPGM